MSQSHTLYPREINASNLPPSTAQNKNSNYFIFFSPLYKPTFISTFSPCPINKEINKIYMRLFSLVSKMEGRSHIIAAIWAAVVVVTAAVWSGAGAQQVPCYFIFGDSLVDNGNNNQLQSLARADYLPYGIDFGGPTGRFSNGKTTVDVIGK